MVSRQQQASSTPGQVGQQNSKLFVFFLVGICLFFSLRYSSRLIEYSQEQYKVQEWNQKIEQANREQAELLAFQKHIQTDAYVEEVSRLELLMARPGDTLVVILPDGQEEPSADAAAPSPEVGSASGAPDVNASEYQAPTSATEDVPFWRRWFPFLN